MEDHENLEEMETERDTEENDPTGSQSTHGWNVARRKWTNRRKPKVSETVISRNVMKNKLRENRRDMIKKKKEETVNGKRDISHLNSDHV